MPAPDERGGLGVVGLMRVRESESPRAAKLTKRISACDLLPHTDRRYLPYLLAPTRFALCLAPTHFARCLASRRLAPTRAAPHLASRRLARTRSLLTSPPAASLRSATLDARSDRPRKRGQIPLPSKNRTRGARRAQGRRKGRDGGDCQSGLGEGG
jgi:hypothetical protein